MYRKRMGIRRYRKLPQQVSFNNVTNKAEAKRVWERLMSVNLLDPIQISKLWLQYTPKKYYFKLFASDMEHTNKIIFNFVDGIYRYFEDNDHPLNEHTKQMNQFFFRDDIQAGYDFFVEEFNGCNMYVNRFNSVNHEMYVSGNTDDFNQTDENWRWFNDGIIGYCKIHPVQYYYYYWDNGVQKRCYIYWTFSVSYQMYTQLSQGKHCLQMESYNRNYSLNLEMSDNDNDHVMFRITPQNREAPLPDGVQYYTFQPYIVFVMYPKGYYHSCYVNPERKITIYPNHTP